MKSAQENSVHYCDYHHLQSIATANCVKFTNPDVTAAMNEMNENKTFISSISQCGISIGLLPLESSRKTQLSAYANGYWLGKLTLSDGDYFFDYIALPSWLLYSLNTPFQDEAKILSYEFASVSHLDESDAKVIQLHQDGEPLRAKLRSIGLLDTTKKSIHVTKKAVEAMDAGCISQSSRILTIVERYEAIMANPSLAAEIAIIDRQERQWKKVAQH